MPGRAGQGVWDGPVHTAHFKVDKQGSPVQHMELCSALCASMDGRGVWGRMDTCVCVAGSLCSPPGTITRALIRYTPPQNKKCF